MDKQSVIDFFNGAAADWDARLVHNDAKINRILDYAGICAGQRVLDVGCGTGVLVPDYLARSVAEVVGVDISPRMIEAAQGKFDDPRVRFVCADVETAALGAPFDRVVVYNAFPHFPDPDALAEALAARLADGGRLTIAHGMSRARIDAHHSGPANAVSRGLMAAEDLAAVLAARFTVDVIVSDDDIYVVSGVKQ